MNNKFIPLGSILSLHDDKDKLMVVAYKAKSGDDDRIYDYAGVRYPEGLMEDYYILFDRVDVSEVYFTGYDKDEFEDYIDRISILDASGNAGGLTNDTYGSGDTTSKKRGHKEPTKPLSKSEMYSKYTSKVISGGQTKEFDFSKLKN